MVIISSGQRSFSVTNCKKKKKKKNQMQKKEGNKSGGNRESSRKYIGGTDIALAEVEGISSLIKDSERHGNECEV
jgi:hypothetical protein